MYFIYTRASTELQSDSNALQLSQVYSAIESDVTLQQLLKGHEFARSFDEQAMSRTIPMIKRPQGAKLIQALSQGGPHILIVTEQHRFNGNTRDWIDFLEFCINFDVIVYDASARVIASNPEQRHRSIASANSHEEYITILRRTCRERAIARAKHGLVNTHFTPHGWVAVLRSSEKKKKYRQSIPCPQERVNIEELYKIWQGSVDDRKKFLGHKRVIPGFDAWFTDMQRNHKPMLKRYKKHKDVPTHWSKESLRAAFKAYTEGFPIFDQETNSSRNVKRERQRRRTNRGYAYPLPARESRRPSASRPSPENAPLAS